MFQADETSRAQRREAARGPSGEEHRGGGRSAGAIASAVNDTGRFEGVRRGGTPSDHTGGGPLAAVLNIAEGQSKAGSWEARPPAESRVMGAAWSLRPEGVWLMGCAMGLDGDLRGPNHSSV